MPIIQSCRLVCTDRGHNKEYLVELHEDPDENGLRQFRVDGRYGRIGSVLTGVRKYRGSSQYRAEAEYEKVRNEKLNKGYREVPLQNAFLAPALPPVDPPPTPRRRATATPVTPTNTVDFYDDAPRQINL